MTRHGQGSRRCAPATYELLAAFGIVLLLGDRIYWEGKLLRRQAPPHQAVTGWKSN